MSNTNQVVPVEPTEEMLKAAEANERNHAGWRPYDSIYKAMLAAAPQQPTPEGYISHDAYRGAMERVYLAEKRLKTAETELAELRQTQQQDMECGMPIALEMPRGLNNHTKKLVVLFAQALANKLYKAELKYGYSAGWLNDDWMDECRQKLMEHIHKGDPRDVAAYCAFLWYHNELTTPVQQQGEPVVELEWITILKKELFLAKHTRSFTFGRNEVIELLGASPLTADASFNQGVELAAKKVEDFGCEEWKTLHAKILAHKRPTDSRAAESNDESLVTMTRDELNNALGLLKAAQCPCCEDKAGAYYDNMGNVHQCQWCYEVGELSRALEGK
ncbi:MAG TPA: hypothetical protein VD999_07760 [Vitreimonas sp.]|nr:hypothetical protein [Vitreimonas sp.]